MKFSNLLLRLHEDKHKSENNSVVFYPSACVTLINRAESNFFLRKQMAILKKFDYKVM